MSAPKHTPGPKPAAVEITAYKCGTCGKGMHEKRDQADKCCTCEDCGGPIPVNKDGPFTIHKGHRGSGRCEPCANKFWLKLRREDFRRDEARYLKAKSSLERQEAACASIAELAPDLSDSQRDRLNALAEDQGNGHKYEPPKCARTARTDFSLLRLGLFSTESGVTEKGRAALKKAGVLP